jgi:hypothetical protein
MATTSTSAPVAQQAQTAVQSTGSSRSRTRPSANDPFRDELIAALDIPSTLTDRPSGTIDVREAWAKYKGVNAARSLLYRMRADGTWSLRKPASDEIVELFVSKTSWHDNYTKLFPLAEQYPLLMSWLEQDKEAPSNTSLFGVEKAAYSFSDLREVLKSLQQKRDRKGKRKQSSIDEGSSKKKSKKALRIA